MNKRKKNIEVFLDTEKKCKTNSFLVEAIRKSNEGQYVILEEGKNAVSNVHRLSLSDIHGLSVRDIHRYEKPADIIVSKKRSLEAASAYKEQNVLVHNFASATNPGGGVTRGDEVKRKNLFCSGQDVFGFSVKYIAWMRS